ncbi:MULTISPECIES: sigma-70 family RNA polymerase sigma factor [unclassified Moorena]|uniref:RNA polymerase sigma factor n=1 Tax=unclassified Moorena TaxID=2683338 RepID=UPI0025F790B0|nr:MULTISPECIES: sigma-70 family RNA polymerase sigma factor [unclassified Moorena]
MVENRLHGQHKIDTQGDNCNKQIGADYIQGDKEDNIIQTSSSLGVGVTGTTNAHNIAGTINEIEGHNIQAKEVNIYQQNGCKAKKNKDQNQPGDNQVNHRLVITLNGVDLDEFIRDKELQEAVSLLLQKASGDTSVNFEKIEEGSIKITLNGSSEGLKRLADLIQSGELGELGKGLEELGLSVEDAKLVVKDTTGEDGNGEADSEEPVDSLAAISSCHFKDKGYGYYMEKNMPPQEIAKLLNSLSTQIEDWLYKFKINSTYTHEDIIHDVFLLVLKLIEFGKIESHFNVDGELLLIRIKGDLKEPIINPKAWLRTVAFNYVRGLHREYKRFVDISSEMWESLPSTEQSNAVSSRHTHPMQYIENLEMREKIKQLPDEDSKILELFYFDKLSCAEISILLESKGYPRYTEETIRKKKCRALNKLRQLYLQTGLVSKIKL